MRGGGVGKQIAILIGITDEPVLLRQRCRGGCHLLLAGLGLDGLERLGKQYLGQGQHALVAVDALLQSLRWPTRPSMAKSNWHSRAACWPISLAWRRIRRVSREGLNTRSSWGSTTVPGRSALAWLRSKVPVWMSRISRRRA